MKNYSALGARVLARRKVEIKFQPVSKKLLSESLKIQLFQTPATVSAHGIPSLFTDSVKTKTTNYTFIKLCGYGTEKSNLLG